MERFSERLTLGAGLSLPVVIAFSLPEDLIAIKDRVCGAPTARPGAVEQPFVVLIGIHPLAVTEIGKVPAPVVLEHGP